MTTLYLFPISIFLDYFISFAMTSNCHCEEHGDEAVHLLSFWFATAYRLAMTTQYLLPISIISVLPRRLHRFAMTILFCIIYAYLSCMLSFIPLTIGFKRYCMTVLWPVLISALAVIPGIISIFSERGFLNLLPLVRTIPR